MESPNEHISTRSEAYRLLDIINLTESDAVTDLNKVPEDRRDEIRDLIALRKTPYPTCHEILQSPEWQNINSLVPSRAFKAIDALLARLFGEILPRILPAENSMKDIVRMVFGANNWERVGEDTVAQMVFLQTSADMIHLRGELVERYVKTSEEAKKHLTPVAQIEYAGFGAIADETNRFFLEWKKSAGMALDAAARQARGFTNEFATVAKDAAGTEREVPWHEMIFAGSMTQNLAKLYGELAGALRKAYADARVDAAGCDASLAKLFRRKIDYYETLAQAWATSDLNVWRIADTLLPGQTAGRPDPIHIHTIEVGYGADAIQRVPEASMRCPDEDFADINRVALETRKRVADAIDECWKEDTFFSPEAKSTMNLVRGSSFAARHFMGAGMEMVFKPAGQILPNEDQSRREAGLDISSDPVTMKQRIAFAQGTYRTVFGEEAPASAGVDNLTEIVGRRIAGHEFVHPIGITRTTNKRLNPALQARFIEEWKATAGGMVLDEWSYFDEVDAAAERETMDDLKRSLEDHILHATRHLAMRDQKSSQPYVRKSCMLMKVAEETGLLIRRGEEWKTDLAYEKVKAFFERLNGQFFSVLKIYDRGTEDDLRAFLRENLQPTPFLEYAAAKLDANSGRTDMPSIVSLCALPERQAAV